MHQAALAQEMGAAASRGGSRASLLAFLQISLTSIFCEDDLFNDVQRKAEEHAHHLFQRARREGGCLTPHGPARLPRDDAALHG